MSGDTGNEYNHIMRQIAKIEADEQTNAELVEQSVEQLRAPLYRLLLSATGVDAELRNEVDDAFKALDAAAAKARGGQ
jgi:hypothetical protein